MTIVVAQITDGGVVIASDGQTTGPDGRKVLTAQKVHSIQFANGCVVVGESGDAGCGADILDHFSDAAKNTILLERRSAADLLEESMKWKFKAIKKRDDRSDADIADHIRANFDTEFLMGCSHNGIPNIYSSRLSSFVVGPRVQRWAAIGCGAPIADYLLSEFHKSVVPMDFATLLCVWVVEAAKKHVDGCGGETNIVQLYHESNLIDPSPIISCGHLLPRESVDKLSALVSAFEEKWMVNRNQAIKDHLLAESVEVLDALKNKGKWPFSSEHLPPEFGLTESAL